MSEGRLPFLAQVEPRAAAWLLREVGSRAEAYAREVVAHRGTPAAEIGLELQRALRWFRAGERWLREQQASERPAVVDVASEGEWCSTAEAAAVLGVDVRMVRNYIAGGEGPLPAVLVKGAWRIRAEDLEEFRRSRCGNGC